MSALPRQRELPHVAGRRLDPKWRARRDEVLELERELMLTRMELAEARAEIRELRDKSRMPRTSRG